MKMLSGSLLLLAAEQAYAQSLMVPFPNHEAAAQVLVPGSLVLLVLGGILFVWGVLTEARPAATAARVSS